MMATGGPNFSNLQALIHEVKQVQRDPQVKEKWQIYCSIFGNNQKDPSKHPESFLQGFLQGLNSHSQAAQSHETVNGDVVGNEIFVGNLPHDISEDALVEYFCQWGEITRTQLKEGKGFAFVTFASSDSVDQIMLNHGAHEINGRHVDCARKQTVPPPARIIPKNQLIQQQLPQLQQRVVFVQQPPPVSYGPVRSGIVRRQVQGPYVQIPQPQLIQNPPPQEFIQQPIQRRGPAANGVPLPNEIFVGGLPMDVTDSMLLDYFGRWGEMTKLDLKLNKGFAFITFAQTETVDAILESNPGHEINGKSIDCKRRMQDPNIGQLRQQPQQHVQPFVVQQRPTVQLVHQPLQASQVSTPTIFRGGLNAVQPQIQLQIQPQTDLHSLTRNMENPEGTALCSDKIFVGGLPRGTQKEHVIEAFQAFGTITKIDLKQEKGFAFVHFQDAHSVNQALNCDQISVAGQLVDCRIADNRLPKLKILEQSGHLQKVVM